MISMLQYIQMRLAGTVLAMILATRPPASPPQPAVGAPVQRLTGVDAEASISQTIKSDIEAIAGPGSVDVSSTNGRLFNVRIAVPSLSVEFCGPIFDREVRLYRLFPDFNFDFYLRLRSR
jgi:hypothetical protein